MLYEEFAGEAMRNCIGKTSNNVQAALVHKDLLNKSFENNFKLNPNKVCQSTGWPIDWELY